jgi:crotonobetainyl-CoA:carnitine CoA-transferase CaiB-like acyl-CoA transferase
VIGAATDRTFQALSHALGEHALEDERFATQEGRLQHRDELEAAVAGALALRSTDHWLGVLASAGVPAGRVSSLEESLLRHDHDSHTGLRDVDGSGIRVVAPPVLLDDDGWAPLTAPGGPGRDADAVLGDLGIGADRVATLRSSGVIG